jgi:endoglucanase
MQTTYYVPAGLDFLSYTAILAEIKKLGFNSIRIPISDQMVRDNAKIVIGRNCHNRPRKCYVVKDPEFLGKHPLDVLDILVKAAHHYGLFVILDNHFSSARTPASYNKSLSPRTAKRYEATWTSKGWTEASWIKDWVTLARRYLSDPTVIGFDLRNEPHTNGPGPWSLKTYLKQGATWGRYPSKSWNPASDWAAAATKGGNAVLAVNPHLLMFVEGVQLYPDPTQQRGVETYWWGSILRGVAVDPIVFKRAHQLVYSPHEWGPWKFNTGTFTYRTSYDMMAKIFDQNWGFILKSTNPVIRNPIWLGEFNTCNASASCVSSRQRGGQGQWFQILIHYLRLHPEVNWDYYPINGTNSFDETSNNSVLRRDWKAPRQPSLMAVLRPIMSPPK